MLGIRGALTLAGLREQDCGYRKGASPRVRRAPHPRHEANHPRRSTTLAGGAARAHSDRRHLTCMRRAGARPASGVMWLPPKKASRAPSRPASTPGRAHSPLLCIAHARSRSGEQDCAEWNRVRQRSAAPPGHDQAWHAARGDPDVEAPMPTRAGQILEMTRTFSCQPDKAGDAWQPARRLGAPNGNARLQERTGGARGCAVIQARRRCSGGNVESGRSWANRAAGSPGEAVVSATACACRQHAAHCLPACWPSDAGGGFAGVPSRRTHFEPCAPQTSIRVALALGDTPCANAGASPATRMANAASQDVRMRTGPRRGMGLW